jgi:hypothetical protein
MGVREVSPHEWAGALDSFSREHRAWLATVEEPCGATSTERPLRSIRAEHGAIVIELDPGQVLRVDAPNGLRLNENGRGAHCGLDIEGPLGVTRLRFRVAALPEELDGIAPPELR